MKKTLEEMKNACKYVFNKFLNNDFDLISNKNYEPTISGRMAIYFRDIFPELENEKIFVDVEYNKYERNEKLDYQNKIKDINNKPIRPDIIIHKRFKQKSNLLYCELKKNSSRYGKDRNKVEKQVKDKDYAFGLYINRIKEYKQNGKAIQFQIFTNKKWFEYYYYLNEDEILEINK